VKKLPLCCPCDKKADLLASEGGYVCTAENCLHGSVANQFRVSDTVPVIISEELTDTVCSSKGDVTYVRRPNKNMKKAARFFIGTSETTKSNCQKFLQLVKSASKEPKILIVGGGEPGVGTEPLWHCKDFDVHSIDIYKSESVDLICDAHYLPLKSQTYDGVWIQAVLEHVVEPIKVVSEIFRVLKLDGFVYAESPFMQQVHEGAYDFQRFTVLGHRYLFKNFDLIEMGGNKGPEQVLAWSVKYLIWGLTRNRKIASVCGLAVGLLLRPLKHFVSHKSLFDASSGVFFLGKKNSTKKICHKELVTGYKGLQAKLPKV